MNGSPLVALREERYLLGVCLHQPEMIPRLIEAVGTHSTVFGDGSNAKTYAALVQRFIGDEPITLLDIANDLKESKISGTYVGSLCEDVTLIDDEEFSSAISTVKDRAIRRNIHDIAINGAKKAKNLDRPLQDSLIELQVELEKESSIGDGQGMTRVMGEPFSQTLLAQKSDIWSGRARPGIHPGLCGLHDAVRGLMGGNLYILAGRPGMGKSALMSQIAEFVSSKGYGVVIFSLEMTPEQVVDRMFAQKTGVELSTIWKRNPPEIVQKQYARFLEDISKRRLIISMESRMAAIRSICKQAEITFRSRGGEFGMIGLDYIGLMRGSRSDNRTVEIGEYANFLKGLAMDTNAPVVALSQLNRGCEMRMDKRPGLSDLRDSGDVEAAADVAIMLYRDAYYRANSDLGDASEIIIEKNRHGKRCVVPCVWNANSLLFSDPFGEE